MDLSVNREERESEDSQQDSHRRSEEEEEFFDEEEWISAQGCTLTNCGLLLPDGTLYFGGQFRLESFNHFPNTRYMIVRNKRPDHQNPPPRDKSFGEEFAGSTYLENWAWDSSVPAFLINQEVKFFEKLFEEFRKHETEFLRGSKTSIPVEAKPFIFTFPSQARDDFNKLVLTMLYKMELDGRSVASQLGDGFGHVQRDSVLLESKRRLNFASCLSVMTSLECLEYSSVENLASVGASSAKAMFGVTWQALNDWAKIKIDIRKKVLVNLDWKLQANHDLLFSTIFCDNIFPTEVVERIKEKAANKGLSMKKFLQGTGYKPDSQKPTHSRWEEEPQRPFRTGSFRPSRTYRERRDQRLKTSQNFKAKRGGKNSRNSFPKKSATKQDDKKSRQ